MSDNNPHKFFTAKEVAALAKEHGVSGVPTTESGMIKWIKRHEPDYILGFARKRMGQKGGGGTEYNWSFFHEALYPVLDAEIGIRNAMAPYVPPGTQIDRRVRYRHARSLPPDLDAPTGFRAEALAIEAKLAGDIEFSPFQIRRVERCRVRMNNKRYFSLALEPFHGLDVCVTTSNAALDLLWVLAFDKPRYSRAGPGRLICIADAKAGKTRYISVELQQAAEQKRAAAYAKRRLKR